jgi:RNA polymerase sigma-54 factor
MFISQVQSLRPLVTAHLAETMSLLSLSVTELEARIEEELASNPALELSKERLCPTCHRPLRGGEPCPVCSAPHETESGPLVIYVSQRSDFAAGFEPNDEREDADLYMEEARAYAPEDLASYVVRQIAPELEGVEKKVAVYLATHLDEDGLLTIRLEEVARYEHCSLEIVRHVQQLMQRADPLGVGSASPREALLVQLAVLDPGQKGPLAERIIAEGYDLLIHRQFRELARQLGACLNVVMEEVQFIGENLNPFPARAYWGDGHATPPNGAEVFYRPDIVISYLGNDPQGGLSVELILPTRGTLRVSSLYRQGLLLAQDDSRDELKNDLERASLFVKCLQQRTNGLQMLVEKVVTYQRDYIFYGDKHMKPLTRARIAKELTVNESTISRAVANKVVQLPNGRMVPLSAFFDRSLNVRTVLKEIIASEDRPLSDFELAERLDERGFHVARRTIAKYRALEGILPAHLRREEEMAL